MLQNSLIQPSLIPQTVVFGILDSVSNDTIFKNDKIFMNHILVIFKLYVLSPERKGHKYK